jgi:hypothetical protein
MISRRLFAESAESTVSRRCVDDGEPDAEAKKASNRACELGFDSFFFLNGDAAAVSVGTRFTISVTGQTDARWTEQDEVEAVGS